MIPQLKITASRRMLKFIFLDTVKFDQFSQGIIEIQSDIRDAFIMQAPTILDQLNHTNIDGDSKRICYLLHKLKGSISFFGADSLSEEISRLEKNCGITESNEYRKQIALLTMNIRVLMMELQQMSFY